MIRHKWLVVALVCLPSLASAQPAERTVEAEQLFRDAQRLLREGDVAAACTAFEGSQRLEPNGSTLMNLADCRERNGQLASAWGLFLQAATQLRASPATAAVAESARQRALAVEPRLSYLIINVPDASRVDGLEVTRNGVPVDPATWNRAIPVDGGMIKVVARVPGRESWAAEVTLERERDKQSVDVPRLEAVAQAATADLSPGTPVAPAEPRETPGGGLTLRRKVAIGAGVVALGVFGVGIASELSARSAYEDYRYEPEGESREALFDDATSKRRMAQAMGVLGVGVAGIGVFMWVTGDRKPSTTVSAYAAPSEGGVVVRGAW